MDDERLIRSLIEMRADALYRKDALAAVDMLASDVVAFELVGALQTPADQVTDADAVQAWLDGWDGPVSTDIEGLRIHVSGDLAFCHSLNRLRAKRRSGASTDFWMRSTLALRKLGGVWKIVHAHTSVPFHTDGSFRAALDLKP